MGARESGESEIGEAKWRKRRGMRTGGDDEGLVKNEEASNKQCAKKRGLAELSSGSRRNERVEPIEVR